MTHPTLKMWSKEPAVKDLKKLLNKSLNPSPGLTETDEQFGPKTQEAVRRFQKVSNMVDTGVVDANTWNALFRKVPGSGKGPAHGYAGSGTGPGQAAGNVDSGPVTHGVKNPHTRPPTTAEAQALKGDLATAGKWIEAAIARLGKPDQKLEQDILWRFVAHGVIIAKVNDLPKVAATIKDRFVRMKQAMGQVTFRIQTIPPITTDGKLAIAFTRMTAPRHIAVWLDPKNDKAYPLHKASPLRAETLVHELAHFAWDANDIDNPMTLAAGLTDAESYAAFAAGLQGYEFHPLVFTTKG